MRLAIVLAPLIAALPAWASAQSSDTDLEEVIVTATRAPQTVQSVLSSVTVITSADIERLQPQSLAELLQGLPGISVATTGGLGTPTSLFLRGTNSDHVLVLIDGVVVGSVTTGAAAWEQLPVEQVDRIEIVRGPESSLYGSQALGGVIQIFTRQAGPEAPSLPSFVATGGSHGTYQSEAGYSGSLGNGWYNAALGGIYTDGIAICETGAPVTANCYTTDPRQGFWNASATLSGGYRFEDGMLVSFDALHTDGVEKFDGNIYTGNESRVAQQALGLRLAIPVLSIWQMSIAAGQSLDESTFNYLGTPAGFFDSRRNTLSWLNTVQLASEHRLQFGVDDEEDIVASDAGYALNSRDDVGEFVLYRWNHHAWELQLSGRHDHNQQFGDFETGSAAAAYHLSDSLRLMASYGSAFKAPTFDDLYYPYYGDPSLRPETSHSSEVGVDGSPAIWLWSVHAYQTTIRDLIEYDPATFLAANIDRARIQGVETQLGAHLEHWRAQLYWTWLDPLDRGEYFNALLPLRARNSVRAELDWQGERFGAGASFFITGARFEDPANTERLGGYGTLDLRASWRLAAHWLLQGLVRNALDKRYETSFEYNEPGITAYLTVRYSPSPP